MLITVYRPGTDCTNGGISSRKDYLTEDDVILLRRPQWRDTIIVPLEDRPGMVGPMDGGNVGEFEGKFYRIHDRYETQEDYDALSR